MKRLDETKYIDNNQYWPLVLLEWLSELDEHETQILQFCRDLHSYAAASDALQFPCETLLELYIPLEAPS